MDKYYTCTCGCEYGEVKDMETYGDYYYEYCQCPKCARTWKLMYKMEFQQRIDSEGD